jgi:hypothetical protein
MECTAFLQLEDADHAAGIIDRDEIRQCSSRKGDVMQRHEVPAQRPDSS